MPFGKDGVPAISVVVSTYRRSSLLPRLVAALEAQTAVSRLELVIVDDGSDDATWTTLQRLAEHSTLELRPIRLERNKGQATGRNVGWRASLAPSVAFTDDDCVPQPEWAAALLSGLEEADVVEGRTVSNPEQAFRAGPFSRTVCVMKSTGLFQTCNIAYRRTVLERLGGFDEGFRRSGEDVDLGWRALDTGATHLFEPDALVWHDVSPSSFLAHLRSIRRWDGVVLAVRQHPGLRARFHRHWFWKRSHPPALLALAGAGLALTPGVSRAFRAGALGLFLPYLRFRTLVSPLRGGRRRRLAAVPFALVADLEEVAVMAVASTRYRTLLL